MVGLVLDGAGEGLALDGAGEGLVLEGAGEELVLDGAGEGAGAGDGLEVGVQSGGDGNKEAMGPRPWSSNREEGLWRLTVPS